MHYFTLLSTVFYIGLGQSYYRTTRSPKQQHILATIQPKSQPLIHPTNQTPNLPPKTQTTQPTNWPPNQKNNHLTTTHPTKPTKISTQPTDICLSLLPDRIWHKVNDPKWGLGEGKVGHGPRLEPCLSMLVIDPLTATWAWWAYLDMDPNLSPGTYAWL